MRYSWFTGERQLNATTSAVTDDRGVYRVFGLQPDEYAIRVNRASTGSIRTIAPGEIDAALNPQRPSAPVEPPSDATFGFSPVYYPGTTVAADAALVPVAVGAEVGGIDFAVKYVPTARIAGTIVGGGPAGRTQVRLLGGSIARSGITTDATAQPGGSRAFTFSGVAPGHYTVMAWTSATGAAAAGATEWASSEVDVNGRHIDGLELRLRPGLTVSGRVVFEDLGGGPMPQGWQVGLSAVLAPNEASVSGTPELVRADGTFTVQGITPARYRVRAVSQNPVDASGRNWTFKSATANGANVTDVPVDLRSGVDLTDVIVTHVDEADGTRRHSAIGRRRARACIFRDCVPHGPCVLDRLLAPYQDDPSKHRREVPVGGPASGRLLHRRADRRRARRMAESRVSRITRDRLIDSHVDRWREKASGLEDSLGRRSSVRIAMLLRPPSCWVASTLPGLVSGAGSLAILALCSSTSRLLASLAPRWRGAAALTSTPRRAVGLMRRALREVIGQLGRGVRTERCELNVRTPTLSDLRCKNSSRNLSDPL